MCKEIILFHKPPDKWELRLSAKQTKGTWIYPAADKEAWRPLGPSSDAVPTTEMWELCPTGEVPTQSQWIAPWTSGSTSAFYPHMETVVSTLDCSNLWAVSHTFQLNIRSNVLLSEHLVNKVRTHWLQMNQVIYCQTRPCCHSLSSPLGDSLGQTSWRLSGSCPTFQASLSTSF